MKRLLWALMGILLPACALAQSVPSVEFVGQEFFGYARFHYQMASEACFNPRTGIGGTTSCSSTPLVLIPRLNLAPLTVGGAFGRSKPMLTIGAAENLTPVLKAFILGGLKELTAANTLANLKALLAPSAPGQSPDVILNIGAKIGLEFTDSHKVKGEGLLSIGPAILF